MCFGHLLDGARVRGRLGGLGPKRRHRHERHHGGRANCPEGPRPAVLDRHRATSNLKATTLAASRSASRRASPKWNTSSVSSACGS